MNSTPWGMVYEWAQKEGAVCGMFPNTPTCVVLI